jgi:hypothetical protein
MFDSLREGADGQWICSTPGQLTLCSQRIRIIEREERLQRLFCQTPRGVSHAAARDALAEAVDVGIVRQGRRELQILILED